MRAAAALVLVTLLAVAAGGCGHEPSGDAFGLSAEQLSRRPVDDGPSPWTVEVATARPDVPAVVVQRQAPPGVDDGPPTVTFADSAFPSDA